MIFYFSGTGNSAWVARQLAEGQNEELLSIAMEIDRNKAYKLKEGEKVGQRIFLVGKLSFKRIA